MSVVRMQPDKHGASASASARLAAPPCRTCSQPRHSNFDLSSARVRAGRGAGQSASLMRPSRRHCGGARRDRSPPSPARRPAARRVLPSGRREAARDRTAASATRPAAARALRLSASRALSAAASRARNAARSFSASAAGSGAASRSMRAAAVRGRSLAAGCAGITIVAHRERADRADEEQVERERTDQQPARRAVRHRHGHRHGRNPVTESISNNGPVLGRTRRAPDRDRLRCASPKLDSPIEMPSTAAPASAARRGQAGAKSQSIRAAGHQAKARCCGGSDCKLRQDALRGERPPRLTPSRGEAPSQAHDRS